PQHGPAKDNACGRRLLRRRFHFDQRHQMAADRPGPWSRWDVPTNEILPPQYDTGAGDFVGGGSVGNVGTVSIAQPSSVFGTGLVDQKINTIDPSFYDCVYNTSLGQTVIERCYKDLGCCATTCCTNEDWKNKYGWAVALIVVFCIIVVIAVVVSMIVWLINRAKDKRQKRLLDDSGLSRATSNMSLAQSTPGGYHFGTGPFKSPPAAGYRY
uniref:CX domain-containing protein n=1 Tax=Haemonchus contortus TaxID=6289 RepID=A0A7I4Z7L3_HAECO